MGALVGLGVGIGLLLVWSAFVLPAPPAPRTPRPGRRRAELLAGAGLGQVSASGVRGAVRGARAVRRRCVDAGRLRHAAGRGRLRRDGRLPAGGRGRPARARRRQREFAEVWPEAVDNLASRGPGRAVAARRARRASASAGPSRCAPPFDAFALDYQVTGRFGECLDRLKDRLADPVGDRVVEGLRIAREVGGGELGRLLRNLSGYLRDEARTRSEMEARQAWTVNGARLAVAAPWLVLLFMSLPVRGHPPLRLAGRRARAGRRRRRLRGRLPADDADRPAAHRAADPVVSPAGVGRGPRRRRRPRAAAGRRPAAGASAGRSSRVRVLPYVRDLPAGRPHARAAASRRPRRPRRRPGSSGRCCASAADAVERVLGGAASVRRRLERADLDRTVHEFRVEQVLWGLVGVRRGRGVRRARAPSATPAARCRRCCCAWSASRSACWPATPTSPARSSTRERRILAEFPTVAELLALAVAAGESPVAALDRVVRRSGGELSRDLGAGAGRGPHRRAGRRGLRPAGRDDRRCRWWPGSRRASPSRSSAARRSPTSCTPRPPTSARPDAAS